MKVSKSEKLNYNHLSLYLLNGQCSKLTKIHMIWDMPMMPLIQSIEKEGACDKDQEMLLVWAVWTSILPWIHSKQSE